MTLEEARALPTRSQFKETIQTRPDGSTLHVREVGRAHIRHVAEDDIMMFTDTDGYTMCIGQDEEGLYKYHAPF